MNMMPLDANKSLQRTALCTAADAVRYVTGDFACIDDTSDTPKLTTEARLIRALRIWQDNPNATLENGNSIHREISSVLEWFICGCIPYGSKNLGGWWSDGVIHLEIIKNADNSIKLFGVTWIDCDGVAPFEIDFEMKPDIGDYFERTIFRIGNTDESGLPKLSKSTRNVHSVLVNRPRYTKDWAMAVELTPPENHDRANR